MVILHCLTKKLSVYCHVSLSIFCSRSVKDKALRSNNFLLGQERKYALPEQINLITNQL